jgi:type I restriction enzyme, R subunit
MRLLNILISFSEFSFDILNNEASLRSKKDLKKLCENEGLNIEKLQVLIDDYNFTRRKPLGNDIVDTMKVKLKLLKRKKVINSVTDKVSEFVDRFYER